MSNNFVNSLDTSLLATFTRNKLFFTDKEADYTEVREESTSNNKQKVITKDVSGKSSSGQGDGLDFAYSNKQNDRKTKGAEVDKR